MDQDHPRTTTPGRRSSVTGFVRGATFTVVSLFLILVVVVTIAWLVLNPHKPGFRVTSIYVTRGKYEMELNITNPNRKIELMLDRFNFYGEVRLPVATVQPPVYLDKMSEKNVKIELVVRNSAKLVHKVNVKMEVRARFKDGMWPSREKNLDVNCVNLDVGLFSPQDTGKHVGIGKDCHV